MTRVILTPPPPRSDRALRVRHGPSGTGPHPQRTGGIMAAKSFVVLETAHQLAAGLKCPRDQVIDAGAFNTLHFHKRVPVGTGDQADGVIIEHSTQNEDNTFMELAVIGVGTATAGGTLTVTDFLRFVR